MTIREICNKYVGIPYKHHGRDMSGLDCWGLFISIYADLGYELYDQEYDELWSEKNQNYFIENYHDMWEEVTRPAPLIGVLFKNKIGVACHIGIMISDDQFMHSRKGNGVILSRLSDKSWKARIVGFYRLKVMK